jgi:hypothetical protein
VSVAQVLLFLLNALVTLKLFASPIPLAEYLMAGYAFVLHAGVVRPRLVGRAKIVVPVLSLMGWTAVWLVSKPVPSGEPSLIDQLPFPGLKGFAPNLVGASYIYLKVYDLIRRVQNGAPAPGVVEYATQMMFFPSYVAGPVAGPEPFAKGLAPTRATIADGLNRLIGGILKLYVIVPLLEPANLLGQSNPRVLAGYMSTRDVWAGVYGSSRWS